MKYKLVLTQKFFHVDVTQWEVYNMKYWERCWSHAYHYHKFFKIFPCDYSLGFYTYVEVI